MTEKSLAQQLTDTGWGIHWVEVSPPLDGRRFEVIIAKDFLKYVGRGQTEEEALQDAINDSKI